MSKATREQIVEAARSYLGVRWHHQGRSRAGLDCIGLVVRVAHDLGLSDYDISGYARMPDGPRMLQRLRDQMGPRVLLPEPGDVLLIRFERNPMHVAIMTTGRNIIHAYANAKEVVEHRLDGLWATRIVECYQMPGLVA
jgi:cell wall-associated NlpC family hydrolase